MINTKYFVIENGILKKYNGSKKDVTIPDGVTSIGDHAFWSCKRLTSITIPDGVTSIGEEAFEFCENLTSVHIGDGVTSIGGAAFADCKILTSIDIPDSVTSIGKYAFSGCESLKNIAIPNGVTSIGDKAFEDCWNLRKIDIPKSLSYVGKDVFYGCDKLKKYNFVDGLPECFYSRVGDLYPLFTDNQLKKYILNKTVWPKLDSGIQADIFINRHSETLIAAYKECVDNPDVLGKTILGRFSGDHSSNALNIIELFQNTFPEKASAQILEQSNKALSLLKPGKAYYEIENIIKKNLDIDGDPIPWLDDILKDEYYVSSSYLPEVIDIEGKPAPKSTMPYLFLYSKGTDKILKLLDQKSFQDALYILAEKYLENSRRRSIPLAWPICHFANESLMEELIRWCGKGSSCFDDFRKAVLRSDTRAAMIFADKYGDLDEYARIRHTDADTIRNQFLSDVGLNEAGEKTYDLGNQTVTARLQKDLSFLFELPNGKIAKSLPKKGADEEKYSYASADFSEMKKNCKKIVKNQANSLFADFLSGRARKADIWKNSYLKNPLLRQVASLVVWAQGNNTFILTDSEVITSNGTSYTIGNEEITVAHPMEMESSDLNAWQKYFSAHGIKQPFEQIWEPVIDAKSVKEDRYKGCMIPYYRFLNKEKHGINVVDEDYHDSITITLSDCKANIYRIDYSWHSINVEDRFEIKNIAAHPFTRKANHIIAYFDRVTIYDRIRKDDVGFINLLPHFTLAQITDFIKVATESNSTNVMAMLLDYKNKNFADFDPMEEFSLDF